MKNDWLVKKLEEVVNILNGYAFKSSDYISDGVKLLRMSNITREGILNFNNKNTKYLDPQFLTNYKKFILNEDDLVVAMTDMSKELGIIGKVTRVTNDGNILLNQRVGKFEIANENIDQGYLYYALLDEKFKKFVEALCAGGLQYNVSASQVLKYQLAIPPYSIQKKIVERLDAIRKAQELCDQQIQKTEELFESLLIKELSNLDKSQIKKLNDLCTKITDGAHKTPTYISTGIPFLSVRNIINGVVDFTKCKFISQTEHDQLTKRCSPEFEDVLIAKSGTTGVATLVNIKKEFSLFVSVALLKPNRDLVQSKFLVYFLNSESGKRQMAARTKGGIVKNLHIEEIRELEIPIPSQKNQQEIIEKLEAVQNYKKLLQEEKELLNELFDSVLDKSIKGELDS